MTNRADYTDPAYPSASRSAHAHQPGSDDLDVAAVAGTGTDGGEASKDPEQIRRDIERTRRELGSNVDALADKVTPAKIMQRQTGKVRSALGSVSEKVMGPVSDATDAAGELPGAAVEKAKGNPMAVGLIAFGVGWLVASLMPPSEAEQRMASQIKDAAEPLVEEAVSAAKSMGESMKEPAENAAAAVKEAATDAVDTVKEEAADATDNVKAEAADATENLKGAAGTSPSDPAR